MRKIDLAVLQLGCWTYCAKNVYRRIDCCVISVYNNAVRRNTNETKRFDQKFEDAGFVFERHGGNHDIYRRGNDTEKVPRYNEVNESLARMILRKWKLL